MTPEERSEEMRRRVMMRWQKQDPLRNKPSAAAIELVKQACAMGATVQRICEVLDIPEGKFKRFMKESEDFREAVKAGRQYEHDSLANKLIELALKGNISAFIFSLKSRHNYVDSGVGAATVVENKVSVNFVLPDALKPERYLETLTASAEVIAPRDAVRALAQPGVKGKVLRQLAIERSEENDNGQE
ncbi:MAG: hypothetical protein WBE37_15385 [Bryobacteraceae bacterium]